MTTQHLPRGIVDNNPGNLRPGVPYHGIVGIDRAGSVAGYCIFVDMVHGVRAMAMCLKAYKKDGISTLRRCFARWAPFSDNNQPVAYAKTVAEPLGIGIDDPVDLADPVILLTVIRQIIRVENGPCPNGQWVANSVISEGIDLAE